MTYNITWREVGSQPEAEDFFPTPGTNFIFLDPLGTDRNGTVVQYADKWFTEVQVTYYREGESILDLQLLNMIFGQGHTKAFSSYENYLYDKHDDKW